jgi:hypothetical protein
MIKQLYSNCFKKKGNLDIKGLCIPLQGNPGEPGMRGAPGLRGQTVSTFIILSHSFLILLDKTKLFFKLDSSNNLKLMR